MVKLLPNFLLALFATGWVHADESWIEGRWVASRDHTIEELAQGNSEGIVMLAKSMGEIDSIWVVDSGQIQVVRYGSSGERANYFIRPIRVGVFEMLIDLESGDQQYVIVHRRSFGFCYEYGGDYSHDETTGIQECYVRDDA